MWISVFRHAVYLTAVFFVMISRWGGLSFAAESELEPLSTKSLHFSGKYEENGVTYNDTLSINDKVIKLITFKDNKPFGVLFPNERNECTSNCEFKVHFGDRDISLSSESQPKIRWWFSKDCVWSKHKRCEIYEQTNGFIIYFDKNELFYDIKKLVYTKNEFSHRDYKNTNFYEMYYEPGFYKRNYLRSNFKNSRTIFELKLINNSK